MLEFDLACPQVDQMKEKGALLKEKEDYFARAKALADNLSVPVIIKLSPQQPDLVVTARGVREAGAAAVTCHNRTLGFMVDIETAKPLSWTFSGVGGPWMLPIALRWVAKIHLDMPDLPIFGSVLPSNDIHIGWAIDLIKETGSKKIGFLGLSFKLRALVVCHCFRESETVLVSGMIRIEEHDGVLIVERCAGLLEIDTMTPAIGPVLPLVPVETQLSHMYMVRIVMRTVNLPL